MIPVQMGKNYLVETVDSFVHLFENCRENHFRMLENACNNIRKWPHAKIRKKWTNVDFSLNVLQKSKICSHAPHVKRGNIFLRKYFYDMRLWQIFAQILSKIDCSKNRNIKLIFAKLFSKWKCLKISRKW